MTSYCIIDKHPINTELSTANVFCWPSFGRKRRKTRNHIRRRRRRRRRVCFGMMGMRTSSSVTSTWFYGPDPCLAACCRDPDQSCSWRLEWASQTAPNPRHSWNKTAQTTNPLSLSSYSKPHIQTDPRQKQSPNDCKFYDKTYQPQKKTAMKLSRKRFGLFIVVTLTANRNFPDFLSREPCSIWHWNRHRNIDFHNYLTALEVDRARTRNS